MRDTSELATVPGGGRLAANIMHFARALRTAGLPVGPGKVLDAIRAVEAVGLSSRQDFYWTLHAVFVNRRDQREVFDHAFHAFWRDPDILQRMMNMIMPQLQTSSGAEDENKKANRRVQDALRGEQPPPLPEDWQDEGGEEITFDAALTYSARDVLSEMDFEQMSSEELRQAKKAVANMRLPIPDIRTRRTRLDPRGARADLRATLRAALRSGPDHIPLRRKSPRRRHPPLVVLCDISGSMNRYSRLMLHFLHAVTNDRDRVHTFLFGTRLTNVTRHLRAKDVDVALEGVAGTVEDWSGGTRIGACLHDFNRDWSRRVLSQGAVVLFISDGLDRDGGDRLAVEMERLRKSCRRLIWLNPMLRFEGFQPKSMGYRAIMPHVDDFRPVHSLNSLAALADALSDVDTAHPSNARRMAEWRAAAQRAEVEAAMRDRVGGHA